MANQLQVPSAPQPSGNQDIVPSAPILKKQTYASPMSFVGITRRTTAWVREVGDTWPKAALATVAAIFFLLFMYTFLAGWYLIAFGLFGLFTIPFRLIRRCQRKALAVQNAQLATMQTMMVRQSEALASSQQLAPPAPPAPPAASEQPELPAGRDPTDDAQDVRNWT